MPTLKELRRERFLSQEDLARESGVAAVTINRLENGKQQPTFKTIRRLAKALKVEPGQVSFSNSDRG